MRGEQKPPSLRKAPPLREDPLGLLGSNFVGMGDEYVASAAYVPLNNGNIISPQCDKINTSTSGWFQFQPPRSGNPPPVMNSLTNAAYPGLDVGGRLLTQTNPSHTASGDWAPSVAYPTTTNPTASDRLGTKGNLEILIQNSSGLYVKQQLVPNPDGNPQFNGMVMLARVSNARP